MAFFLWAIAGALVSFGALAMLTIGLPILVAGGALVAALVSRHGTRAAWAGAVSGVGAPSLYIAYLNRDGPGDVCTTDHFDTSCGDEWNPWPWLGCGLALIVVGIALYVRLRPSGPHR